MVAITEQVRRLARRFRRPTDCSACGLPRGVGRRLICGPRVQICESCIAAATGQETADDSAERCSFCDRHDARIARTWPQGAICVSCVELLRSILAEDDQRSRPAT